MTGRKWSTRCCTRWCTSGRPRPACGWTMALRSDGKLGNWGCSRRRDALSNPEWTDDPGPGRLDYTPLRCVVKLQSRRAICPEPMQFGSNNSLAQPDGPTGLAARGTGIARTDRGRWPAEQVGPEEFLRRSWG